MARTSTPDAQRSAVGDTVDEVAADGDAAAAGRDESQLTRGAAGAAAAAAAAFLAACGGGNGAPAVVYDLPGSGGTPLPASVTPPTERDAVRFLTQASFGVTSPEQVKALRDQGFEAWLQAQFNAPLMLHVGYIDGQRGRDDPPDRLPRVTEEMSYEAVWQHWLRGEDPLRARMVWALLQIMVISNVAPDIRPHAMSSYMDMLGRNAFGNYRQLLQEVTLHPAMGYYLNLLESAKADPQKGTHPNENYAREVLQLFSIGLVRLNLDGSPQLDAAGVPLPTYDEAMVKGFAAAFSGWSYGGLDNTRSSTFHDHDENDEALWIQPMKAWAMHHSPGPKSLLDGRVLPAGQTPEKDMADALDSIFRHPNVGPFIGRQLIQRLVTSNPSPAYIARVAAVFNDNGAGVRGDLRAVVRAVLLDAEARSETAATQPRMGKQREPVLRLAAFLHALGAESRNGRNSIHYLDGADDALGQSPLLAPSVFNFYSPNYRPAGPVAAAGMVAPEFQITTETTVVGSLNFFADLFDSGGYGSGDSRLVLKLEPLMALANDPAALIDRLDLLFFCRQMSAATRERLRTLVTAIPAADRKRRVTSALLITALSPDFVIQK